MITIHINGKKPDAIKSLAERIARAESMSGRIVSVYYDESRMPAEIPESGDVVIIVGQVST